LLAKKEVGIFSGSSPRQAALKAANKGYTNIQLREKGTKKVHIFKGSRKKVSTPANKPSWMPYKIWKPNVKNRDKETEVIRHQFVLVVPFQDKS
jgi:hypothetical protein